MDNVNELHIKIIKCSKLKARRPGKHGENRTFSQWVDNGGNGGNWLQNHLWGPNYPRGYGIDDFDDDDETMTPSVALCQ